MNHARVFLCPIMFTDEFSNDATFAWYFHFNHIAIANYSKLW